MSGLIQGADKRIHLFSISKVFPFVICTIEAWEKRKENLRSPSRKQRNSGKTVFRGRPVPGRQTEVFGHHCTTAKLQQQAISSPPLLRSSRAPQGQPAPLSCSCWGSWAAPHRGQGQQGTVAVPMPLWLGCGYWGWGAGDAVVLWDRPLPWHRR